MAMQNLHSSTVSLWREVCVDNLLSQKQVLLRGEQRGPDHEGGVWLQACTVPVHIDPVNFYDLGAFQFKAELASEENTYYFSKEDTTKR